MAISNNTFSSAFDVWGRRNPSYEKHYENSVIKPLADFGIGTNEASDAKGKVLGAGYEVLIMAFFIGLYSDKRIPLNTEEEIKDLRQPIQYWGSIESRKGRRAYPRLKEYIFTALVARTPVKHIVKIYVFFSMILNGIQHIAQTYTSNFILNINPVPLVITINAALLDGYISFIFLLK